MKKDKFDYEKIKEEYDKAKIIFTKLNIKKFKYKNN
jgi:hypothetical protein